MKELRIDPANAMHGTNEFIHGDNVTVSHKYYHQVKEIYNEVDSNINDDTIVYDVYKIEEENVDLMHGQTVIYPLQIKGQCNMTKGHFHADENQSEIYICESGEGLLLKSDKDGNCFAQQMRPGTVHLIDGHHSHRCINTSSSEPLIFSCYWSKQAGYDYECLEKHPYSVSVYLEEGKVVYKWKD